MKLKPLKKMDKKGVLGLNTVREVFTAFLILAVLGIAILLALVSLRDANIFTSGSRAMNDTTNIVGNVSGGLVTFFESTGTIFAILIVVVIILAIAIIIAVVSGFGARGAARGL